MDRRQMLKTAGAGSLLFATGSGALLLDGCPPWSSVYNTILKYTQAGLVAFGAILNILSAAGVVPPGTGTLISTIIALVKAGFADLQTAVTNYENAPAADKATLLGKISTALTVLEGMLNQFWTDLNLPGSQLATLISSLLGIILSTLAGFQTQLPVPSPAMLRATTQKKLAAQAKGLQYVPTRRSVTQFKQDFNKLLVGTQYAGQQIR